MESNHDKTTYWVETFINQSWQKLSDTRNHDTYPVALEDLRSHRRNNPHVNFRLAWEHRIITYKVESGVLTD